MTKQDIETEETSKEEKDFIKSILQTEVMQLTKKFLVSKKLVLEKDFFETLHGIWFDRYSKSSGKIKGSSAFEHIFLGKNLTFCKSIFRVESNDFF